MRPKIAGIAVCKNEEQNIGRMLSSVAPYVDKFFLLDTGSTDKTVAIAKSFGEKVVIFEKPDMFVHPLLEGGLPIFNFDEAKNFILEKVPKQEYPYILWLDSDDELVGGVNIPKCLQIMEEQNISALFCRYLYYVDFDERGQIKNINIEHLRERIIKNDGSIKWIGALHETLIEQRPVLKNDNYDIHVIHHTEPKDMEEAVYRNVASLQEIVLAQAGSDPRYIYYLGKTYFDLHESFLHDYTIALLKQYLLTSGWEEERAQAWMYLAQVHIEKGEADNAISASLMGLQQNPYFPDAYITLAIAYLLKQDWKRALHWVKASSQIPLPKTTLVITPRDLQVKTLDVIFNACMNMGQLDEAEQANTSLTQILPGVSAFEERKKIVEELKRDNALAHSIAKLAFYYKEKGDQNKLLSTLSSMPDHIATEPTMVALRNDIMPPTHWGEEDIVIYAGPGLEKWSAKSLESGLGGSESAIIYLSREFVKQGYKVTIYGDPGAGEEQDQGVVYKPYFYFNMKDHFNIFVAWRQPGLFDLPLQAKQKYLWLHDIPNPADYTKERLSKIDKIIVLSKWHRDNLSAVPDEKMYISANGYTQI